MKSKRSRRSGRSTTELSAFALRNRREAGCLLIKRSRGRESHAQIRIFHCRETIVQRVCVWGCTYTAANEDFRVSALCIAFFTFPGTCIDGSRTSTRAHSRRDSQKTAPPHFPV